jgi:hypothetical protein
MNPGDERRQSAIDLSVQRSPVASGGDGSGVLSLGGLFGDAEHGADFRPGSVELAGLGYGGGEISLQGLALLGQFGQMHESITVHTVTDQQWENFGQSRTVSLGKSQEAERSNHRSRPLRSGRAA